MESINARSPEERFGMEGSAGAESFARPTSGQRQTSMTDPTTTPNRDAAGLTGRQDALIDDRTSTQGAKETGGLAQQAEQKADAGLQKSAEGLNKAADMVRSATEDRSGTVGTVGTQAADVLGKGASYLEKGDSEQFIQDLEALVRRRPVESLLVAAGAGFILSKAMR